MNEVDMSKGIFLRDPKDIYSIRFRMCKFETDNGTVLNIPIVLANPKTIMAKAVRDILLDKENNVYMKAGQETIVLSISPIIDGKTDTLNYNKPACNCYFPFWSVPLADPDTIIYADGLEMIEAYDELGNDFSKEKCDFIYKKMIEIHKDRKVVVNTDFSEVDF